MPQQMQQMPQQLQQQQMPQQQMPQQQMPQQQMPQQPQQQAQPQRLQQPLMQQNRGPAQANDGNSGYTPQQLYLQQNIRPQNQLQRPMRQNGYAGNQQQPAKPFAARDVQEIVAILRSRPNGMAEQLPRTAVGTRSTPGHGDQS